MLAERSRRVRAEDFESDWYVQRARQMRLSVSAMYRKYWEWALVAEVFASRVGSGSALGFGVGREPVAAWLAAHGADRVVATDLDATSAGAWRDGFRGCQHAAGRDEVPWQRICSSEEFERVEYRAVDMTALPEDLSRGAFDFVWSCGSFEHIGGIETGLQFFCRSLECLRPGGLAVHTTELNALSDSTTLETNDLVLFRRRDLEQLACRVADRGDRLWPLDLEPGTRPADAVVLDYPYDGEPHLAIRINDVYVTTSVALVAERSG